MKRYKFISLFVAIILVSSVQLEAQSRSRSTRSVSSSSSTRSKAHQSTVRVSRKDVVYKTPQRKVLSRRTLPNRNEIVYKGMKYYYHDNKYYSYSAGHYVQIVPEIGFRIRALPYGYLTIRHKGYDYYWFDGLFYARFENGYQVVQPERGTLVYELPHDYERVQINGFVYYEYANVLYEKVQVNRTRAYEVIGFVE